MFLASPFYADFYDQISEVYREAESLAREIARFLPEHLTDGPASPWEGFIGSFIKFTLGPLLTAQRAMFDACEQTDPEEIIAWDEPGRISWWGGRQLVEDVADAAAEITGAPVRVRSSSLARATRSAAHPVMARAQAAHFYLRQMRPLPNNAPGRHDVVIASLGRSVRGLVRRVGDALTEHGLRVLVVQIPFDPLNPDCADGALPCVSLHTFRDQPLLTRCLEAVDESFDWHRQFREQLSRAGNVPLRGRLRSALVRRMHNILAYDMPFALYHQELWRRLLDSVRPRTLLAFNHYGTALAPGVLQANERGAATVLCQHGLGSPHWRSTTLLPFDLALTFGEFSRELLRSVAYRRTRFEITGHSGWDGVRAAPELQRPDAADRPIVLATMQTVERHLRAAEPKWWLSELGRACRELGATLIIKPHPNENDTSDYEELARQMPDAVRFIAHGERPLEELIEECTILATRFSTTAMQAIIAGKPVMTIFPTGARERYPFAAEGAAVKIDSCDEILPTLRALLTDNELQDRLAAQ
ncbi:MAG: hypothetical protein ACOCX2_11530, partial [Armatimonadota bacterium]